MKPTILSKEILRAARAAEGIVRKTPALQASFVTPEGLVQTHYKLENLQVTGSFKFRGALNRLTRLSTEEKTAGVVAASTGNHGAAVACAADTLGIEAHVFVPEGSNKAKIESIRHFGGVVSFLGQDCVQSEIGARRFAGAHGMVFISPYNDPLVIAGQGTVGLELNDQVGELDAVFVSLGGGGLASGIAVALKEIGGGTEIVACSPECSPVMAESIRAGQIVEWPVRPTLSDGTAGGIEPGAITFELCKRLIDRHVIVSEDEIRSEMLGFIKEHHQIAEGAAGVALAGFRKVANEYVGRRAAVVVCGGNVGLGTLRRILTEEAL